MRLFSDGSLDPGFQTDFILPGSGTLQGGSPITDWSHLDLLSIDTLVVSDIQPLIPTPDGKLLAAIGTSISTNLYNYQLVRLNGDGTLDNSFPTSDISPATSVLAIDQVYDRSGQYGEVNVQAIYPVRIIAACVVQSNGAVMFCGSFTNVNGAPRSGIARLRPDLTLDGAFPVGAGPVAASPGPVKLSGLSVDAAGKIWVTGNFISWDGIPASGYVRLNTDGTVDTTCSPQPAHYPQDDYPLRVFSGALPGSATECYAVGPHLLANDTWPRALSRMIPNLPPPLVPVGMMLGVGFTISFNSETGALYSLETSTNLTAWNNWSNFTGNGQQLFFTDPASLSAPNKFYRVRYQ
jgi:uncharacterized delta-60 repeat protein